MATVHDGHRERVKRRFLTSGLSDFEPHNALELILFYSIPRKDTNELAHRLIDYFGSYDKVFEAEYEQLLDVKGMTPNTAAHIKLLLESYRYYEQQKDKKNFVVTSGDTAKKYCVSCFVGETTEKCFMLCFNSKLKLINSVLVSAGTVDRTAMSMRKIVEIATVQKAVSVILTHNHPDGFALPSANDLATTRSAMKALAIIGVELNDHIIVAGKNAISLATEGIIANMRKELGFNG
ncbi:MAG: DNA repair protein RadC [Oscillospiraceae bacterium]